MALKAVLDRIPQTAGVEVVESPAGISIENANRLDAGDIDFGIISAPWVVAASQGTAPFMHAIDLRIAAPMNLGPNFFICRADSKLRKVADLRGKRVAMGMKDGGMAPHAEAVFAVLGIGPGDLERVYVDFAEGAEMLATGAVDAQFQCPVPNRVINDLSERVLLRILSYDPAHLDAALKAIPHDRRIMMKKGALRGLDQDVPQLGVLNLLVTHARSDAATVEHVVRAIVLAATELGRIDPLFAGLAELLEMFRHNSKARPEFGGVELHQG
ncbi:MAG: TAXI family TRAP transporter solute-binding subunit, partial [Xanthobacteraceae bacterium]